MERELIGLACFGSCKRVVSVILESTGAAGAAGGV